MRTYLSIRRLAFSAAVVAAVLPATARELSFEERVRHQRAIEEAYWRHRTWPADNPGPKPSLSHVLPDSAIRAKVETYAKRSNALEVHWQRPITSGQLQAEMVRMARDTRDAATLRELFRALGDDPFLIAETLARQTLTDRLIRSWYARDSRFHGDVKSRAEMALEACGEVGCMPSMGGEYHESTWRRSGSPEAAGDGALTLGAEEWREQRERLARRFGADSSALPLGKLSGLEETPDAFILTAVLADGEDEITTASVAWRKTPFDSWWAAERDALGADVAPALGQFALPQVDGAGCVPNTWTPTHFEVPDPRTGATAVWTGTEMIVWGGWVNVAGYGLMLNTGGRYDPATDSWTVTSTGANAPVARTRHTAVWTGTEMVVWGGRDDSVEFRSGGRYDPSTDSWEATSSNLLAARSDHSAVWTGTEMIVWGGRGGSDSVNTGGRYDPDTDTWTPTSTGVNVPAVRWSHSAVWTGSEMIVWGGHEYTYGPTFETGGRYDPDTDTWTATSTGANVPTGRHVHTAVWTGSEMIVWGGWDGTITNTGGRYDPGSDTWTATSMGANVPDRRDVHTAVWTGSEMIVWGGRTIDDPTNTGGRYDPDTDTWTPTSTGANVPGPRTTHTAVWTGTEMIVWSGFAENNTGSAMQSGGRYDPSTDSWVATAVGVGAPEARRGHSTVWTGAEMVVWGGRNDVRAFDTGGRYDPATDSWTATSTATVPEALYIHTTVWSGTEMIVWGGWIDDPPYHPATNTGGRYDPTTDSWTATSMGANVPSARDSHTAVWTVTEMIVWGGREGASPRYDTGGRYDPETDTWHPTSTGANVPSGRRSHTAVWTGSEMIVWGGYDDAYVNTGGRYALDTDTWHPTSTDANVPSERSSHTAVWTGREMIVWGGHEAVAYPFQTDSGGQYDPSTDRWTATPVTNAPSAREGHTALWTGTEMIVWGGGDDDNIVNTGGRYHPSTGSWNPTSTAAGVPTRRERHGAVWTGTEMIVWGGHPSTASGGLYCACEGGSVSTWYPDTDGDGYGVESTGIPACTQPLGYVAEPGDCDDTSSVTHPGAPEVNDGLDNQCPGDTGRGLIDEISGVCGFLDSEDKNRFSWPAQTGATSYEVARSASPQFGNECLVTPTLDTYWVDTEPVPDETCHHYLVRSVHPNLGSWGADSTGTERTEVCP